MLGYLVALFYTKILIRIDRRFHLKEEALKRWQDRRHHAAIVGEGFEFHFFMTYIFPMSHGAMLFVSHHTGAEFLLRLYGGG